MASHGFEPSWLSKRFAALAAATARLPARGAFAVTIASLALVAAADHATGPQFNFIIFYLLVVCFASLSLGGAIGFATVALAAVLNGFQSGFPLPRQSQTTGAMLADEAVRVAARYRG